MASKASYLNEQKRILSVASDSGVHCVAVGLEAFFRFKLGVFVKFTVRNRAGHFQIPAATQQQRLLTADTVRVQVWACLLSNFPRDNDEY